ncbi:hypothetical protein O4G76_14850 [Limimaricola sp. G21655-S1]|nr:hypothetical protein [Limimaricola sp. G21655-S1]MCZ4262122.1 hypothetical protein [Limimaricola sp. G21655-S1]
MAILIPPAAAARPDGAPPLSIVAIFGGGEKRPGWRKAFSCSRALGQAQEMRREITVRDRLDVLLSFAIDRDFDRDGIAIDIDEEHAVSAFDFLDHLVEVQLPAVRKRAAAHMAYAASRLPVIGSANALDLDRLPPVFSPRGGVATL